MPLLVPFFSSPSQRSDKSNPKLSRRGRGRRKDRKATEKKVVQAGK